MQGSLRVVCKNGSGQGQQLQASPEISFHVLTWCDPVWKSQPFDTHPTLWSKSTMQLETSKLWQSRTWFPRTWHSSSLGTPSPLSQLQKVQAAWYLCHSAWCLSPHLSLCCLFTLAGGLSLLFVYPLQIHNLSRQRRRVKYDTNMAISRKIDRKGSS